MPKLQLVLLNTQENVEVTARLSDAVLDENVDVNLIRYFTQEAWFVVMDVVGQNQSNPVYVCKRCYHDLVSIVCDHCLSWDHLKCVGLKQPPK